MRQHSTRSLGWLGAMVIFVGVLVRPGLTFSAPFDSGSTGADGAFAPAANVALPVPLSGVFNFTTVNIPAGVTVTFVPNTTNTPITILASGDVAIAGTVNVNGQDGSSVSAPELILPIGGGGAGGSGGYAGGAGGISPAFNGGTLAAIGGGLGPGSAGIAISNSGCPGSFANAMTQGGNCNSQSYGTKTLVPLIGGSGGTGGPAYPLTGTLVCTNGCNGGGGGGGGGAILIASSGVITVNGSITSNGGNGGDGYQPGGPGSGGGIRLIANTIAGSGVITATGGGPNRTGYVGSPGRIRLESNTFSFSGSTNPAVTVSTPGVVNLSPLPTLSITAVGGVAVPSAAGGLFTSPDITLPASTANPVTATLTATNIPVGTTVKVTATPRNGSLLWVNSTALSGTNAASTATASVTLSTTVPTVLRAEATFAVLTASNSFPVFADGEKVEKVLVASVLGGESSVYLITESGREVPWR